MSITVSSKNQIVIPKDVRKKMNIRSGDVLVIEKIAPDHVVIKKAPTAKDLIGSAAKIKSDPVKRVREIRDSWR